MVLGFPLSPFRSRRRAGVLLLWNISQVASKIQNMSFFVAHHFRPLNKVKELRCLLFSLDCLFSVSCHGRKAD